MNTIAQFAVLFIVCMAGTLISNLFPFPLPVSVSSMIVMICLLSFRVLRIKSIAASSDFLLGHMALFFIPPGVGILAHTEAFKGDLWVLLGICFVATVLTLVVTAFVVRVVMQLMGRRAKGIA